MPRSIAFATLALAACTLAACQKPARDAAPPPPPAPATAPAPPAPPPAPAPASTASAPLNTIAYQCGDKTISVAFGEGEAPAVLSFDGKTLTLPHAISASGARYADDQGNELWTKGMTDGMLTLAGEAQRLCTAQTRTATPPG